MNRRNSKWLEHNFIFLFDRFLWLAECLDLWFFYLIRKFYDFSIIYNKILKYFYLFLKIDGIPYNLLYKKDCNK